MAAARSIESLSASSIDSERGGPLILKDRPDSQSNYLLENNFDLSNGRTIKNLSRIKTNLSGAVGYQEKHMTFLLDDSPDSSSAANQTILLGETE